MAVSFYSRLCTKKNMNMVNGISRFFLFTPWTTSRSMLHCNLYTTWSMKCENKSSMKSFFRTDSIILHTRPLRAVKNLSTYSICERKKMMCLSCNSSFPTLSILQKMYCSSLSKVDIDMNTLDEYLDSLQTEYNVLTSDDHGAKKEISSEKEERKKRLTYISSAMQLHNVLKQKMKELNELQVFISGIDSSDEEIRFMAEKEKRDYRNQIEELKFEVLQRLLPEDELDEKDIILEINSGAGGQEAMLFASEIFEMYNSYALSRGWEVEVLDWQLGELGGTRKLAASIKGENVYEWMKLESGVHRVQRVPKTERQGRIHTSTITVAVLPLPSEIDVVLDPKDLKIDSMRASGGGGQHVNKTDSAVRITHIPTGIVAECQSDRSKQKNMAKAMTNLRTKMFEKQLESQQSALKSMRKKQVGHADRNEKIRTYNYMQDRITDHRIKESMFNIEQFMSTGDRLPELTEKLHMNSCIETLQAIFNDFKFSQSKGKSKKKKKD